MQSISSYIGFALKGNLIVKGLDDILKSRKKIWLILTTNEIQDNSKTKLENYATLKQIPLKIVTKETFTDLNLFGVKILGITDPNLAKAIINN